MRARADKEMGMGRTDREKEIEKSRKEKNSRGLLIRIDYIQGRHDHEKKRLRVGFVS